VAIYALKDEELRVLRPTMVSLARRNSCSPSGSPCAAPRGVKTVQPTPEAALAGFGTGEGALGEHLPADAGDQHVEQAVQAGAVALGFGADALPDDGGQDRQGLRNPERAVRAAGSVQEFPDAVLDMRRPVRHAEDALRVGLVLRKEQRHFPFAVEIPLRSREKIT